VARRLLNVEMLDELSIVHGFPALGLVLVKVAALALGFYCWRLGRRSLLLRINVLFGILVSWNLVALILRAAI